MSDGVNAGDEPGGELHEPEPVAVFGELRVFGSLFGSSKPVKRGLYPSEDLFPGDDVCPSREDEAA